MESIRVNIFATHAGENVPFVQTNDDDSSWRRLNLPHDWAVELPFNSSADGNHGFKPVGNASFTTNLVTLKVADNGSPGLSATQSLLVTVNPLTWPSLSSPAWGNGQFSLMFTGQLGPDYAVQATTNLIDWSTLWTTNPQSMPFNWADTNADAYPMRFYRLTVGPPLP